METINFFIRSHSSLKTHTRFQTKMGTVYVYPFSDQNGTKTLPDGAAHTYIAYLREYPPPQPMYTKEGTDYTWNKLSSFVIFFVISKFIIPSLT